MCLTTLQNDETFIAAIESATSSSSSMIVDPHQGVVSPPLSEDDENNNNMMFYCQEDDDEIDVRSTGNDTTATTDDVEHHKHGFSSHHHHHDSPSLPRVSFAPTGATTVHIISTALSQLLNTYGGQKCELWYQKSDVTKFRRQASRIAQRIRDKQQRDSYYDDTDTDTDTDDDEEDNDGILIPPPPRFRRSSVRRRRRAANTSSSSSSSSSSSAGDDDNETRGLEVRLSWHRQDRKQLFLSKLLRAQNEEDATPERLAQIARSYSAWPTKVARSAALGDYAAVYGTSAPIIITKATTATTTTTTATTTATSSVTDDMEEANDGMIHNEENDHDMTTDSTIYQIPSTLSFRRDLVTNMYTSKRSSWQSHSNSSTGSIAFASAGGAGASQQGRRVRCRMY